MSGIFSCSHWGKSLTFTEQHVCNVLFKTAGHKWNWKLRSSALTSPFYYFQLVPILHFHSIKWLAAESAVIGWNRGCFWSHTAKQKRALTCFISLPPVDTLQSESHTHTFTNTDPCASPSYQFRGRKGALLLFEDKKVSHSQWTEDLSPAAHVSVCPQIAGVQQDPVHTWERKRKWLVEFEGALFHCITLRVHAQFMLLWVPTKDF